MNTCHPYLHEIVMEMITWNGYDIYYTAKRLSISRRTLLQALQKKPISNRDTHKILCYYYAYVMSMRNNSS